MICMEVLKNGNLASVSIFMDHEFSLVLIMS